ncbi:cell envelope integrity protein TolA [Bradyrhizobium sp. SYSU BS000235]|uniref:cell envelope integrity protein TolA n=1 Tax=Bradyrhizobium sp. SYSU BS000235 TaxID=3411332 RepID=UPI003C72A506
MLSSELLTRAGIAVSVTGHVLLLVWVIFFAGAHPFEPHPVEAIAVDIVTPDEIPQPKKQEPAQEAPKPPEPLTLPEISDKAKSPEEKPPEAKPPEEKAPEQKRSEEKPPKEKAKPADPPKQEASAPPPASPPPAPAPQATPATPPPPQAAATPPPPQAVPPSPQAVPRAEPDITEKFGMMFTMPGAGTGDFDAQATQAADVSTNMIAALRAHLKTCTPLPKDVSRTDDIQIVLRVTFTPDGRLANDPMLIKGPRPSPKVLALLQGAISGLQSCQPYTMLPADKYNEWRSVDLTYTPRDFGG